MARFRHGRRSLPSSGKGHDGACALPRSRSVDTAEPETPLRTMRSYLWHSKLNAVSRNTRQSAFKGDSQWATE